MITELDKPKRGPRPKYKPIAPTYPANRPDKQPGPCVVTYSKPVKR